MANETKRRLHWQLFDENGWGVIVSDLDTEQWSHGSADTEAEARAIALRNLDERPSGGKPDPRWSSPGELMTLPVARRVLSVWAARETGPGAEAIVVVLAALDHHLAETDRCTPGHCDRCIPSLSGDHISVPRIGQEPCEHTGGPRA